MTTTRFRSPCSRHTSPYQLFLADRFEDAVRVAMRDPEHHPPPSDLLVAVASAYADRNDDDLAREYYGLALEANPGSRVAKTRLAEYGVDVAALLPDVVVPQGTLATYVGRYQRAADDVLTVRLEGGQLFFDDAPLFPMSDRKFFMEDSDSLVGFNADAAGNVDTLTIFAFGQELLRTRVE